MSQEISVSTPESVDFSHEPAGIGSRFIATVIDAILQITAILGIAFISGAWSLLGGSRFSSLKTWTTAAMVFLMFLVFWGYHIIFENLWNGQTPGKRAVGIRILKDGGYPITFLDSVVRNLLRPVDFLPFLYGLGAVVVFCNSRCKRIGDYAAGTVVVKERRIEVPRSLSSPAVYTDEDLMVGGQKLTGIYKLSEADFDIVRKFMVRRHSIQKIARSDLAREIAAPLIRKLGLPPESIRTREEEFLEKLARAYSKWTTRSE